MPDAINEVVSPNLGVYLDRPAATVPQGGLIDALNCRVRNGRIVRENMGWKPFFDINLQSRVLLIDTFKRRDGSELTIFGTKKDLFEFDPGGPGVLYLNRRYVTGTCTDASSTTDVVNFSGTDFITAGIKVGDELFINSLDERDPDAVDGTHGGWHPITAINDLAEIVATGILSTFGGQSFSYTIRRTFTGDDDDPWISETFYDAQPADDDHWYATNGVDFVQRWDGTATEVTDLSALAFTCKWIAGYKNMLLYGDLLEAGEPKTDRIRNSAIANPENVSTLEASEFNGTELPDKLLIGARLADVFVTYGEDGSVTLIQFVGPPLNFVIRTVLTGTSILSSRSLVNNGDTHEILSRDTGYRFDGVGARAFGTQVFREALRSLDASRRPQAIAFADDENGENLWVVPRTTDGDPATAVPQLAYTEHYLENLPRGAPTPIMIRELPATAFGLYSRTGQLGFDDLVEEFQNSDLRWDDRALAQTFPEKLFGSDSGAIYIFGQNDDKDGAAIESYARHPRVPGFDGRREGYVRTLEPFTQGRPSASYSLKVRLYGSDRPDESSVLKTERDWDLTHVGARWVSPHAVARWVEVEFKTDGANEGWSIGGYRMVSTQAGAR